MRLQHILVPTDFSDGSRAAFNTAVDLARDTGATLTLFHVMHVPASVMPDVILPMSPELMHSVEESIDHVLDELVAEARADGIEADWQTAFGATHVEICEAARRLGADLIVIGTHGHTGLAHVLLGSVAEKVVRKAPCPVLTVRPPQHERHAHP